MNAEVIGTWAGQVWNALNESGKRIVCSPWLVGSRR